MYITRQKRSINNRLVMRRKMKFALYIGYALILLIASVQTKNSSKFKKRNPLGLVQVWPKRKIEPTRPRFDRTAMSESQRFTTRKESIPETRQLFCFLFQPTFHTIISSSS